MAGILEVSLSCISVANLEMHRYIWKVQWCFLFFFFVVVVVCFLAQKMEGLYGRELILRGERTGIKQGLRTMGYGRRGGRFFFLGNSFTGI